MNKKDDDEWKMMSKDALLMQAKAFNDSNQSPSRSRVLIGKLLLFLSMGESFTSVEATNLFFMTTKLFQIKDPALRQIVYLLAKELSTSAQDVMMLTSSLTKDINARPDELFSSGQSAGSKLLAAAAFGWKIATSQPPVPQSGQNVSHRACALRALSKITSPDMINSVERFFKQAIVDKLMEVSSAALVSGIHLSNLDAVKRWGNEAMEAFNQNKQGVVQYHALGLMYTIRQNDLMAVKKLLQSAMKAGTIRNPFAQCMLIRYAAYTILEEHKMNNQINTTLFDYIKNQANNSDMIMLESARAICTLLPRIQDAQAQTAVQTLHLLMNSPKQSLRFAALRTLNEVAKHKPSLLVNCLTEAELLVSDPNTCIATLAITLLLRAGLESGVEKLMKQMLNFMSDITDEFKVILVGSVQKIAQKYPQKQVVIMTFLTNVLREEGGYEYKKSVVEAIFSLVDCLPQCLEQTLPFLCEFIEDCEFTKLCVRILHLIGSQAPKTKNPETFVRFIFNRLILENSNVRAAAINALATMGATLEYLRNDIRILIESSLNDPDDEVRDRACYSLLFLNNEERILCPMINVGNDLIRRQDFFKKPKLEQANVFSLNQVSGYQFIQTIPSRQISDADSDCLVFLTKHVFVGLIVFEFQVDFKLTNANIEIQDSLFFTSINEFLFCGVKQEIGQKTYSAILHSDEVNVHLQPILISFCDFLVPWQTDFHKEFDSLGEDLELIETFEIDQPSLQHLCDSIISLFGCYYFPEKVTNPKKHVLYLSGKITNIRLLIRCRMQMTTACQMELCVRSDSVDFCEMVADLVQAQ